MSLTDKSTSQREARSGPTDLSTSALRAEAPLPQSGSTSPALPGFNGAEKKEKEAVGTRPNWFRELEAERAREARPQFPPARFFERSHPTLHEVVVVQVKEITASFVTVVLLEYGDLEGMIPLSELSRKRLTSVSRITRIGKTEFCVVNAVSQARGGRVQLDLSKKRVTESEEREAKLRYSLSKQVQTLVRKMAVRALEKRAEELFSKLPFETPAAGVEWLYQNVIWPLSRQFGCEGTQPESLLRAKGSDLGKEDSDSESEEESKTRPGLSTRHVYEVLEWHASEFGNPEGRPVGAKLDFPGLKGSREWVCLDARVAEVVQEVLSQKFQGGELKLTAEFEVTSVDGIEVLRKVMLETLERSPGGRPGSGGGGPDGLQITLVSSPRYALTLTTRDRELGLDLMRGALDSLKRGLLEAGGTFALLRAPEAGLAE